MNPRKTQHQMFPLIERWEESGASREDFCKEHQVTLSTFAYWRAKYLKARKPSPEPDFVKLQPEWSHALEITYPNGVTVKLPTGSSLSDVRALIDLAGV